MGHKHSSCPQPISQKKHLKYKCGSNSIIPKQQLNNSTTNWSLVNFWYIQFERYICILRNCFFKVVKITKRKNTGNTIYQKWNTVEIIPSFTYNLLVEVFAMCSLLQFSEQFLWDLRYFFYIANQLFYIHCFGLTESKSYIINTLNL